MLVTVDKLPKLTVVKPFAILGKKDARCPDSQEEGTPNGADLTGKYDVVRDFTTRCAPLLLMPQMGSQTRTQQ